MGKYNEAMNHIVMSDDMKARILSRVNNKIKVRKRANILKVVSAIAAITVVTVLTINLVRFNLPIENLNIGNSNGTESPDVSIGPDIQNVTSLHALEEVTGYPVKELNYLPFEATEILYYAYPDEAIIRYYGDSEYDFITYIISTKPGDVSGFEWEFTFEKEIQINGYDVTIKGEEDTILVVYWTDGVYSKAISYEGGLTEEDLSKMIE